MASTGGGTDGVAERIVAVVALAAVLFIALAMTGTLPLSSPHQAGATQYCTQYEYNPGCQPLVPPLIAFSSTRDAGGNTEVYVMNADGSAQTRLYANPNLFDGNPSWAPDGQKLAFVSARDGNNEIYTMNLDGNGQTRLTNNTASDTLPDWSPDGSKIAFESNRSGAFQVYVMNTDGSNVVRLTNSATPIFDGVPAWSPDSTEIAFASNRTGTTQIWLMNADGSGATRLTFDGAADTLPAWSPDGRKIAFGGSASGIGQIYSINADGTGLTRLTNDTTPETRPTWSPDGSKIAFARQIASHFNVFVMNADGTGQSQLTNDFAADETPDWQAGPPGAPTDVSATAGAAKATIGFTPPVLLGGATIVRYTATATPGGAQGFSTGGPIVVHGLTNGTSYTFTVTASNLAGTGPSSGPTNAVIPQPLELTAIFQNSNNSIYVPGTWTNMPVTVTFFCTDVGGPGVKTVSPPQTVSTEGTGQTVVGSCTDNADNSIIQVFGPIWIDKTLPLLSATLTNADGTPYVIGTWTRQNVTISFSCTDPGGSGIASLTAPIIVSTVGGGQFRSGFCTDNAGNVASSSVGPIMIDKTAPTVIATFKNADGSTYVQNTWTNQNVTVTFACTDTGGAGVASFSGPVTVTTEGVANQVTGLCTDNAGNVTSRIFGSIEIDKTAPVISPTLRNADGSLYMSPGWTSQSVTVSFFCVDTPSGVASVTAPITLSSSGAGQSATGFCTDRAGNVVSVTMSPINIDKVQPQLTATFTNADGSAYVPGTWTSQNVTVTYGCTDPLSGVASFSAPVTFSSEGAGQTTVGSCTDVAGNVFMAVFGPVNIDRTGPVLTASFTKADGSTYVPGTWSNQAVTVTFGCTDGGSGVASFSSPTTFSSEGAGQMASGFCIDTAGNLTTSSFGPIDIDLTPPVLTANFKKADGSAYVPDTWTNQAVTVTFACSDTPSGVASFSGPVTVSAQGAGQLVTGLCTDNAGNVASHAFGPIDIDLTPPEASLAFDPATDTLVVVGTDTGGSGIGSTPVAPSAAAAPAPRAAPNEQSYRLVDGAGNTLVVVIRIDLHKSDAHAVFVSTSYNGEPAIAAPKNNLHYDWATKKDGSLKTLNQDLHLGSGKTAQHVQANFDAGKDQTKITVDPGGQTSKVPGLVLVAVVTNAGALAFQY